jgi:hypothetical protein
MRPKKVRWHQADARITPDFAIAEFQRLFPHGVMLQACQGDIMRIGIHRIALLSAPLVLLGAPLFGDSPTMKPRLRRPTGS